MDKDARSVEVEGERTFAEKFDLYRCFQCGNCTGGCPVSRKSKLNIRKLVRETIFRQSIDPLREKPELWDCTTCKTCSLRCPGGMKPMDLVIGMRSMMVEEGLLPETIMEVLESVNRYGNPWGKSKHLRTEWIQCIAEDFNIKNFSQGDQAEFLFFVGCTPSFHPRIQEIARALVFNLKQAGLDFGILGNEEQCCGNDIRRLGEFGLFEELVENNMKRFEAYGIKKIFTSCPHGFNVLKNEYPQGIFEVFHTTQLFTRSLERGKLSFKKSLPRTVTYHDPCFLGKQNGIFEEPRILIQAIPGLTYKELDRSRERSLCCEGGGGRMWVEAASGNNQRLAEIRVKDAVGLGADVLVTSCPFCVLTLEDALKTSGNEGKLKVMDVMEIVAEAMGK